MTYVDPFLGAGAVWLALLDPRLTPPCAWMGGKRRLAPELLAILGLHAGRPIPCILGDASWWGWIWPTCLDPVTGPQVCAWLRSWRGEDPRALWFRLRDAGPPEDLVERAAGLLWLQARAASGVPVWWDGGEVVAMDGHQRGPYRALQATSLPALVQHASTQIDRAGQRQSVEPSLMASDGRGVPREAGHKADKSGEDNRTGGIVDPGTIAARLDAIRAACAKGTNAAGAAGIVDPGTRILHTDALTLAEEWAPILGASGLWYLDPPYQGCTGYPVVCSREDVLRIADTAARHGGKVLLSEAVGLAAELGSGWSQVQLRSGRKQEWVTGYGVDLRAHLPPILRACA